MDQLEFCNYALSKLGEPPIDAFNDTRAAAGVIRLHYQQTLDALTRKYRWNFARKSDVLKPVWVTATSVFLESAGVIRVNKTAHGLAVGQRILLSTSDYPAANGHFAVTEISANHFHVSAPGALSVTSSLGQYHVAPQHTYAYRIAIPADCSALRTVDGYEAKRLPRKYVIEGGHIFTDQEEIDVVYTRRQVGGTDEAGFDDTFNEVFGTLLAANIAMGVTGAIARRNAMLEGYNQEIMDALMSNVFERRDPDIDRKNGETSFTARTQE